VIVTSAGWATELRAGTSNASPSRAWMSRALLVTEIAMCVTMLSVAGVLLRSVHNLRFQSTGYREDGLLVADVDFPRAYDEMQRKAFVRALVAHIARLPVVIEVGFSNIGQLSGQSVEFPVRGLGGSTVDSASALRVSPRFFAAMGTVVVAGRDFAPSDEDRAAPVAIVNEAFAHRVLARGNAIGQRFVQEFGPQPHMPIEVVGVVEDVKWHDLRERSMPMFYQPYWQDGGVAGIRLALRSSGDYGLLAAAMTREAGAIDRRVILRNVAPFSAVVDGVLTTERLVSETATVLGVLALLLAAIGLFSVLACQVNQRRREIAVRIVLGAQPGAVEAKVLRESMVLLVIGCLIGIPASVLATRLGASLLFGVRSNDPVTIVVVVGVMAATTALAAYIPAKRAASTDPALALRD
jgi:predicted permease